MTERQHKAYLNITAIVIGIFSPVFFLGATLSGSGPAAYTMDLLGWPLDGAQNFEAPTTRFLSALTGGFLLGWGVCVWMLQRLVYNKAPNEVRKAVLAGLLAWFFCDSAGSILAGHGANALINIVVLLAAAGPLWVPARPGTLNG